MKFQNPFDYFGEKEEVPTGESLVETAGYVPAKTRIENMINAGRRLIDSRRENFDFPEGDPTGEYPSDPTRAPGIDMVDIDRLSYQAEARLRNAALKKAKEGKNEKESANASEKDDAEDSSNPNEK